MATRQVPPGPLKLPADIKADLDAQGAAIEEQEKALDALEKLGMDTKSVRERLEWAKQARETLLSEFG